jgi:hypothetical protein
MALMAAAAGLAPGPFGSAFGRLENPYGLAVWGAGSMAAWNTVFVAGMLALLAAILLSVAALLARWRRAASVERQQIKWFVSAAGVTALTAPLAAAASPMLNVIYMALSILLPVAVGLAILRHRLYDIDLIVNRTLVYGALTAVLAASYFGSVVVLQTVFGALTGESRSALVTVLSTLGIAALFSPLRHRLQAVVDRRFYRRKYDASRTLAAFGATLRDNVELTALTDRLLGVVDDTMQPAHASLWIKEAGE